MDKEQVWKLNETFNFFARKDVLGIQYLTENTAYKIAFYLCKYRQEWVAEVGACSLFALTEEELTRVNGFGEKTAKRLIESIAKATSGVTFAQFLRACGQNKLSMDNCEYLAKKFPNFHELCSRKLVDSLKVIQEMPENAQRVLLDKKFWDDAKLFQKYVTMKEDDKG